MDAYLMKCACMTCGKTVNDGVYSGVSIEYFIYLWPVCTVIVPCVEWVHLAYWVAVYWTGQWTQSVFQCCHQQNKHIESRLTLSDSMYILIQLVRFQITSSILTDIVIPPVHRINTCINSNMTLFDLPPLPPHHPCLSWLCVYTRWLFEAF